MLTSSCLQELVTRRGPYRGPRRRMILSKCFQPVVRNLIVIELKSNDYVTQNPTHTHTATCCSRPHDTPQTEFRVSHHTCIPYSSVSLPFVACTKKGRSHSRMYSFHPLNPSYETILRHTVASPSRHCRCELGRLHDAYTRRGMQVPDPVEALWPRACLDGGRP